MPPTWASSGTGPCSASGSGVGVMLGGTILNVVVGLIDQAKTDITGT